MTFALPWINPCELTLGGPVYLPKVYNGRNRTFFFANYEGFRSRLVLALL